MTLDVVGAGFGRTGTLSLKHALEMLGFDRCYHMREVRERPVPQASYPRINSTEAFRFNREWDDKKGGCSE